MKDVPCVVSLDLARHQKQIDIEAQERAYEEYLWDQFWEDVDDAVREGYISITSYEIIYRAVEKYGELPEPEPQEPDYDDC